VLIVAIIGSFVALITWMSQRAQRREGEVSALAVLQTTVGSIKDTVVEVKDMVAEGNHLSHDNELDITQVREQYTALEERVTKVEDRCEIHHDTRRQA
jgi:chaperone required for assembly of F1-ATPase